MNCSTCFGPLRCGTRTSPPNFVFEIRAKPPADQDRRSAAWPEFLFSQAMQRNLHMEISIPVINLNSVTTKTKYNQRFLLDAFSVPFLSRMPHRVRDRWSSPAFALMTMPRK